jgi:hypothetical protein
MPLDQESPGSIPGGATRFNSEPDNTLCAVGLFCVAMVLVPENRIAPTV